jgi:protein TonB
MKNKNSKKIRLFRGSLIAVLLAALITAGCRTITTGSGTAGRSSAGNTPTTAANNTTSAGEEIPFVVVEEMPLFPGGDSALISFIAKNTRYPENARARKAEGRVILRFCVNADGSVSLPSVLRSADPELDAEAIRVTETLPRFLPGKQGGKPVPVWYMIPVEFKLQ